MRVEQYYKNDVLQDDSTT